MARIHQDRLDALARDLGMTFDSFTGEVKNYPGDPNKLIINLEIDGRYRSKTFNVSRDSIHEILWDMLFEVQRERVNKEWFNVSEL